LSTTDTILSVISLLRALLEGILAKLADKLAAPDDNLTQPRQK
jgi:hypothetical protein